MANVQLELTDASITLLAQAIAAALGTDAGSAQTGSAQAAPTTEPQDDDLESELTEAHDKLKAEDADVVKEILNEFGGKTLKTVLKKLAGDTETMQELLDELNGELSEDDGEDDGDDDGEDRSVDEVKKLAQAYSKAEGKDALKEILEDYEIKGVKQIKDLEQEDLNELFGDITEELEGTE